MTKAEPVVTAQLSGLSDNSASGSRVVMTLKSDRSLDLFSFILSFPVKTKRAFKHTKVVGLQNIYLVFHTDKAQGLEGGYKQLLYLFSTWFQDGF